MKNNQNLTADEALYLQAKQTYYSGNPIMTDSEFDALEDTLRENDSFVLDIVGAGSKKKKDVYDHISVMGSLAKVQFKPNFVPFIEFTDKFLSKITTDTILKFEPKLDGNAINIIYDNGKLIKILSRGDGKQGQDYTKKLGNHFPKQLKDFTGEIRGEAVVDSYLFDTKYKKDPTAADPDPIKKYSNARNWVAGILNGDYKDSLPYNEIDVVCFEIVDFKGDTKRQLINWGFIIPDFDHIITSSALNKSAFVDVYEKFKKYRENCKYQLDGIVVKANEQIRSYLGRTDHHPFWAIAIKFETLAVHTKINSIEWGMSKRGELCPVAILEPVELLGSIVTRASLYNASWMLAKKAYPGAIVSLIKSGDIIPKVVDIITPAPGIFDLPTFYNGNKLKYNNVHLLVEGFENTAEYKANKLHSSVTALGIENLGPATCERLAKAKIDLKSLLSTNPDGLRMILLQSGEFKDGRELEIIIESVFAITKVNLWEVIYSLQYRNCGKSISKQLANWMSKIPHDFKGLEKDVIEKFVTDNDRQNEVKDFVGILLNNNVQVIKPEPPKKGLITFEMSGDVSSNHNSKGEFKHECEQTGKAMHSALNKDTTYLVVNSMSLTTSKMQKAQKNGTKVVTYTEFLNIIKNL